MLPESNMRLSLSGFLFEDHGASQSLSLREFYALAKDAGYDGVELRRTQVNIGTPRDERRDVRAQVEDAGLRVTCLTTRHMPAGGTERDDFFKAYVQLCGDLNCDLLKTAGEPEWLHRAAAEAGSAGVAIASNNHVGAVLETVQGTKEHLQAVDHPNYGLLFDAMHLHAGGQDCVACVPDFFSVTRNILVHVRRPEQSDDDSFPERWERALAGASADAPNWPAVMRTYRTLGYDGLITLIENGWPVSERELVARRAADMLRRLWKES
jgi:sugar phosphate isomerase/epimerase